METLNQEKETTTVAMEIATRTLTALKMTTIEAMAKIINTMILAVVNPMTITEAMVTNSTQIKVAIMEAMDDSNSYDSNQKGNSYGVYGRSNEKQYESSDNYGNYGNQYYLLKE
eukprot:TRINITY_DN686_c1_g1_i10.p1 TRINITY_DN686_c1_g1~~TRINITY_DN686_c1_g1_i10.p1  ORF type:complete len:114 (-),score=11.57 TRINITY_DN686_c1_g1_i10:466-807(-)